jgi:5-methylcytosine-specific restriction endonuclease McrA
VSNKAIYNSARWKRLRKLQLSREPLCRMCDAIGLTVEATDVDHIKAIVDGGDPWDIDGLRSLCHACHSSVTRAWQTGRPEPKAKPEIDPATGLARDGRW